jgi:hypothetical protein
MNLSKNKTKSAFLFVLLILFQGCEAQNKNTETDMNPSRKVQLLFPKNFPIQAMSISEWQPK